MERSMNLPKNAYADFPEVALGNFARLRRYEELSSNIAAAQERRKSAINKAIKALRELGNG